MAPLRQFKNWDPRKVLDLDPTAANFTCVGSAPTKGHVRCRIRIDIMRRCAAVEILNEMTATDIVRDNGGTDELIELAELLLCTKYHQDQATDKADEWSLKVEESAREFLEKEKKRAENKLLQKEKKQLMEKVALLEEDLAKESERASQAVNAAANEWADLRGEHAALKKKFETLRKNQVELTNANESWSQKLAKVEEEAWERDNELTRKLFEAEQKLEEGQVAQKREAELSNKLSKAQHKVQKEATKVKKLYNAKEEALCKVGEISNELILARLKAQEAQDREVELSNKLAETEKTAQDREAELMQKLNHSEH